MNQKIKTPKEILAIVRSLKRQGKTIVTTSGSFDILHVGHIKLLEAAKRQGDVVIVLLNSDRSVRNYKGPTRPINDQRTRAETLQALACVDYVTWFDELTPVKILEKIKPQIFCSGADWSKDCIERAVVESYGGKVKVIKLKKGYSTSSLLEKIQKAFSQPVVKAVFLDRDKTINLDQQGYIHKIEDFKFIPGAISALRLLSHSDYKLIILTNQSGIGRGYFQAKDLETLHQWLLRTLRKLGIRIDKIYHCPHHPDDGCDCRKPKLGLLMRAARDFGLSLNKSFVVGDKDIDVLMGRSANLQTIKLGQRVDRALKLGPHYYAKNLRDAVRIILTNRG